MGWYLSAISNYATFTGRARPKAFWMFVLFNIIIAFAIGFVEGLVGLVDEDSYIGIPSMLYSLFMICPSLAIAIRRLHDSGKSGFWILIGLLPAIGLLILLIFYVLPGTEGDNQYGPQPGDSPS